MHSQNNRFGYLQAFAAVARSLCLLFGAFFFPFSQCLAQERDPVLFPLADLNSFSPGTRTYPIGEIGSTTIFAADDTVHGTSLWAHSGSSDNGPAVLLMSFPNQYGVSTRKGVSYGGRVYFAANPAPNPGPRGVIHQIYVTDGTPQGTHPLHPSTQGAYRVIGAVAGRILFQHHPAGTLASWDDPGDWELYSIPVDGTSAAEPITDQNGVALRPRRVGHLLPNGSGLIITVRVTGPGRVLVGSEIWVTDGTSVGTHKLANLPDTDFPYPRSLDFTETKTMEEPRTTSGILLPAVHVPTRAVQLWHTDGTTEGTTLLYQDAGPYSDDAVIRSNGVQVFAQLYSLQHASDGTPLPVNRLYVSDGTPTNTRFVAQYQPGGQEAVIINGWLYFVGRFENSADLIWRTNGEILEPVTSLTGYPLGRLNSDLISFSVVGQAENERTCFFASSDGIGAARPLNCFPGIYTIERVGTSAPDRLNLRYRMTPPGMRMGPYFQESLGRINLSSTTQLAQRVTGLCKSQGGFLQHQPVRRTDRPVD